MLFLDRIKHLSNNNLQYPLGFGCLNEDGLITVFEEVMRNIRIPISFSIPIGLGRYDYTTTSPNLADVIIDQTNRTFQTLPDNAIYESGSSYVSLTDENNV